MKKVLSVINKKSRGFSLIEVMLAITFFGLIVTTFAGGIVFGKQNTAISGDRQRAIFLAEEGISALQSIRQQSWNSFKYNQSAIEIEADQWVLSGEGTVEEIDDIFSRTINFYPVCRDVNDDIADCPASYTDLNTKKAVVSVNWEIRFGVNYSVELPVYLTNWSSNQWTQTNWSGGAGQAIWSDISRYDSANHINHTTLGEIKLSGGGGGGGEIIDNWSLKNGSLFTDKTDTDFSQGIFNNTQVVGSGNDASVTLTQSMQWAPHQDNGTATSANIRGVDCISDDECWAVGLNGRFLRFDGTNWTEFKNIWWPGFYDVDMVSSTDGWAVGESGYIYHYDGTDWTEFTRIGTDHIYNIQMLTANSGWASGANGRFYYYNGTSWAEFSKPTSRPIYGMYMLSASEGWAVSDQGRIWKYNGTSWSQFQKLGNTRFNAIYMVSSTDGWIVGHNGLVHRFNGTTWSNFIDIGNGQLYTVYMISPTTGWFAGNMSNSGIVYQFNGTSWTEDLNTESANLTFYTSYFNSNSEGWAMGSNGSIYIRGNLYETTGEYSSRIFDAGSSISWNYIYWTQDNPTGSSIIFSTRTGNTPTPDGSWSAWSANLTNPSGSPITSPSGRYIQYKISYTRASNPKLSPSVSEVNIIYNMPTTEDLRSLEIIDENNIWAVGGNGKIIHYDGSSWSESADMGTDEIRGISVLSSDNIWACGLAGKIYHYNGTSWSEHTDTGDHGWNDIKMRSSNDGWVVGTEGRIYRYNGTSWSQVFVGWHELFSVFFIDDNNAWASGRNGMMYYYNGTSWSHHSKIDWRHIYGLYFIDANNGWAVGQDGVIYKFNGTSWNLEIKTGSQDWYSVYLLDNSNGWVVGNGNIYKYNSGTWENYLNIGSYILYKIKMIDENNGWTVGSSGQIRRYKKDTGGGYETSGYLLSSAYNMQSSSSIQTISWDQTIPVCDPVCTVKFQLRSAPDNSGSPGVWSAWYGAEGEGTYFTNHSETLVPEELNNNQWVQYRAELAGDSLSTPVLSEIRVNYQ